MPLRASKRRRGTEKERERERDSACMCARVHARAGVEGAGGRGPCRVSVCVCARVHACALVCLCSGARMLANACRRLRWSVGISVCFSISVSVSRSSLYRDQGGKIDDLDFRH